MIVGSHASARSVRDPIRAARRWSAPSTTWPPARALRCCAPGGSAADAAIASNAVLAVTHQHQCGLGGDLFALVHVPGEDRPACLNASGRAGSGASPERLRADGHVAMPAFGDIRSVPIPGCVDGWAALHERFGRLPLADVLEPARAYAAGGFPASPTLAGARSAGRGLPDASDYAAVRGPGSLVRRPGVARALAGDRRAWQVGVLRGRVRRGAAGARGRRVRRGRPRVWAGGLGGAALARRVGPAALDCPAQLAGLPDAGELAGSCRASSCRIPTTAGGRAARRGRARGARRPRRRAVGGRGRRGAARGRPARPASGRPGSRRLPAQERGHDLPLRRRRRGYGRVADPVELRRLGLAARRSRRQGLSPEPRLAASRSRRATRRSTGRGGARRTRSRRCSSPAPGALDALLGTMGGHAQPQILLQLLARRYAAGQDPATALAAPRWRLGAGAVELEERAPPAWAAALEAVGRSGHARSPTGARRSASRTRSRSRATTSRASRTRAASAAPRWGSEAGVRLA